MVVLCHVQVFVPRSLEDSEVSRRASGFNPAPSGEMIASCLPVLSSENRNFQLAAVALKTPITNWNRKQRMKEQNAGIVKELGFGAA